MRHPSLGRHTSVESLERRLLLSAPPEKFVHPVAGEAGVDWAISAYFDQDPTAGNALDYGGRKYSVDGLKDTHFAIADFAAMDRGVDAFAAAGGRVVEAHDGEFDRVVNLLDPPTQPEPDNYVLIDHGGGWRTRYGRLRNGSVTVTPGQVVTAGQKIGQVGGSGTGTPGDYFEGCAWVRFAVTHDGEPVDPFADAEAFWQSPPPYAGDAAGVWYMATVATDAPLNEWFERVQSRHVFHPGEVVKAFIPMHGVNQGRSSTIQFFAPDGSLSSSGQNVFPADRPFAWRGDWMTLPTNAPLGEWKIQFDLEGELMTETAFIVAPRAEGRPEISVYQGSTYVIDGRTTPIDFGRVDQGAAAPRRSFSIQNFGTQPLTISGVTVPEGFSVVGTPPTSVPAGSSRTLTVQLDTSAAGARSGRVTIHCNDAQEGEFDFAVTGTVSGVPAAVEQVYVGGAAWSGAFRGHLQSLGMGGEDGFAVPSSGGAASRPLPWSNLDKVSLRFNRDVVATRDALWVRGVNGADYPIADFAYDAGRRTATWTLGRNLGGDRVTLTLAASVTGGAWSAPLVVLPGDTNGSGVVLADDFSEVKRRFFTTTGSPGSGDAAYSVFHDVDGSGSILANDFSAVKQRFFNSLPGAGAAAVAPTRAPLCTLSRDLFSAAPLLA